CRSRNDEGIRRATRRKSLAEPPAARQTGWTSFHTAPQETETPIPPPTRRCSPPVLPLASADKPCRSTHNRSPWEASCLLPAPLPPPPRQSYSQARLVRECRLLDTG